MNQIVFVVPALGIVALIYMFLKASWVGKQDAGEQNMRELAGHIANGAMAFLIAEWNILSYFAVLAALLMDYSCTLDGPAESHDHTRLDSYIDYDIDAVLSTYVV